jgi:DNA ligase D-like protein (predicted 3'-phosphoesterase)
MTRTLDEYNQKRNFDKTMEPEGEMVSPGECLRFVIQHHIARNDHYDLRLEWHGALLSWAVPKGPSYNTKDRRLAVQVEDHPLEYRNFEGTIPKGEYGGGVVMLWDEGFWEPNNDVDEGLNEGVLKFTLKGRRLKGKWALIRLKPKAGDTRDNWLLLKERDEYTKTIDGISDFTTSIRTGRTMEEIERGEDEKIIKNPFNQTDVQLAKLVNTVPAKDGWLYELKYDGYRIIAFLEGGPAADTGLTGRKIMVDTYGGLASHGGGALSGKDPTKVDRSGAYMARYIAKHIVWCGYAKRCEVSISYAIGKANPVAFSVNTLGTGIVSDEILTLAAQEIFNLRPAAIIEKLRLRNVIYSDTAVYGHFNSCLFPWEDVNKYSEFRKAVEKYVDREDKN